MIDPKFQAIVFDLDGTLADTAADIREALVQAFASEGLPPIDVASTRLMIGGGPRLLVVRALERLCVNDDDDLVSRLTDRFHAEYLAQGNQLSRLYDGVSEALGRLKSAGLKIGVCSNKPDDLCRLLVESCDLLDKVDVVLGSGGGLPRKPDPAPLLRVIEKLGVTPETTLYVGDSETDVKTARAADVPVVLVSYGYTVRRASQLGADAVIDSILELAPPRPLAQSA
ncbi:MAG: HAD-IA family hydrolase [Woeseiaceae bacterium]|jgi:phosphoglycolate phosphatase